VVHATHYPWINYMELSLKLLNEVTWHDFTPKDLVKRDLNVRAY